MKSMRSAGERARKMIAAQSTEQLLDQWELTEHMEGPNVPTVRGWYMDELEKRFPEQFDRWLEESNEDGDLRRYIFAKDEDK